MTPMQRKVLDAIQSLTVDGVAPTMEEIRAHCGMTSKNGVHRCVTALEAQGRLKRPKTEKRAMARAYIVVPEPDITDAVLDAMPRPRLWALLANVQARLFDAGATS